MHKIILYREDIEELIEERQMIRVIIYDPTSEKRIPATVPESAPMQTLIPELVKRLGFSLRNERGDLISYALMKREARGLRQLRSNESLASAGVAEDDELTFTYKIIPGK
jgi:hypothetical protein